MHAPSRIEQTLTLALLALLLVGCFFVLRPFLTAILWAAILAVTAWPLHERLRARLRARPSLSALVIVLLIAIALLAPFVIVGATLAENSDRVLAWLRRLIAQGPPDPPPWVASLPLIGHEIATTWSTFAHVSPA